MWRRSLKISACCTGFQCRGLRRSGSVTIVRLRSRRSWLSSLRRRAARRNGLALRISWAWRFRWARLHWLNSGLGRFFRSAWRVWLRLKYVQNMKNCVFKGVLWYEAYRRGKFSDKVAGEKADLAVTFTFPPASFIFRNDGYNISLANGNFDRFFCGIVPYCYNFRDVDARIDLFSK